MSTIFASADSNIVLSNGGLTATKRSTGNTADSTLITADNAIITADLVEAGYGDALSQTTRGATKVYAEVHLDNQAVANEVFVGICTPAGETVGFLGQSLSSYGWRSDGAIYHNNASVGTGPTYATGHWLAVAVDRIAGTAQFRNVTTSSAWSSSVTVSDITATDIVLGVSVYQSSEAWTANFDGLFIGAPLSGYTRWDGSAAVQAAAAGPLTVTEAADTASLNGAVVWTAALAVTEVADRAVVNGLVSCTGTLGATEGADAASFNVTVISLAAVGTLATAENTDTASVSSTVVWLGSLAAGEYPDDHAAFFGVYWIAVLAAVEDPDVSRGYGNPIDHVDIAGPLAVTEATRDTLNFSGRTSWDSTFALADGSDHATASGLVGWQLLAASETGDGCQISGILGFIGTLAATEAATTSAISGLVGLLGTLTAQGTVDAVSIGGTVANTNAATLALFEQPDRSAVSGLVGFEQLAAAEVSDGYDVNGLVGLVGAIAGQETTRDTCAVNGVAGLLGTLSALEAATDSANVSGGVANTTWVGTLAATDTSDILYFEQAQHLYCTLAATEWPDQCQSNIDSQSLSFLIRDTLFNALARDPFFAGFEVGNAKSRQVKTGAAYTKRKTKALRVEPEHLPYLGVYIVDDIMVPDGDGNAGHVRLNHTLRLGYSVLIENSDEDLAEQQVDAALKRIMLVLADPYIMNLIDTYNPYLGIDNLGNTIIESVPRAVRRQSFGSRGEIAVVELQFECSYFYREDFRPEIVDDLLEIDMTTGIKIGETPDEQAQRLQVGARYKFTPEEMLAALREAAE